MTNKFHLIILLFSLIFISCKKDKIKNIPSDGNYLKIDDDIREIPFPNANVSMTYDNGSSSDVGWGYYITVKQHCDNMLSWQNNDIGINFKIYDSVNVISNQMFSPTYPLTSYGNMYYFNCPWGKSGIRIVPMKDGSVIDSWNTQNNTSGTINYSYKNNKRYFEFSNILINNHSVSGRFIFN
ncbi:MAG: hypothetical protein R2831_05125 [Chitinophagaceae bacterium]